MNLHPDQLATPEHIEPLLEDIGDESTIRDIIREQAKEIVSWGEITLGELNTMLCCFVEGYVFATK